MQISLISYVKNCPHFDASKWSCASENAEEKIGMTQYNLTGKIDIIHDEHIKFMSELSRVNNEVKIYVYFFVRLCHCFKLVLFKKKEVLRNIICNI